MYYLLALCGASFESWMVQILPVHTDTGVLCYVEGEIRIQGKMLLIFFLTGACTLTNHKYHHHETAKQSCHYDSVIKSDSNLIQLNLSTMGHLGDTKKCLL